jgi:hypothetical protein
LLALVIIAIMIIGIVYAAEYYAAYHASSAWIWAHEKVNNTRGVLLADGIQEFARPHVTGSTNGFVRSGIAPGNTKYISGIPRTTPCDPRYSCAGNDQPVCPPLLLSVQLLLPELMELVKSRPSVAKPACPTSQQTSS